MVTSTASTQTWLVKERSVNIVPMNSTELHGENTHLSQVTLSHKVAFPLTISLRAFDQRTSLSLGSPSGARKKGLLWSTRGTLPTWEVVNAQHFPLSSFSAPDLQRPHLINEPSSRKCLKSTPGTSPSGCTWYAVLLVKEPPLTHRLDYRKTQFIPSPASCLAHSMSMDEALGREPSWILNA